MVRAGGAGRGNADTAGVVVKGFRLLRLPVAAGSPVARSLLVKRHEARGPEAGAEEKATAGRTLFCTHLDGYITETQLLKCFGDGFGAVEKVELKAVEKKGSHASLRADGVVSHVNFARVVFKERASLDKALAAATGKLVASAVLPLPGSIFKERLKRNKSIYREPAEFRREVDAWMAAYDARCAESAKKAREEAVDDDGFTKVVSGITRTDDGTSIRMAKRPGLSTGTFSEPVAGGAPDTVLSKSQKKKKARNSVKLDFYRFQQRERKRDEVIDHRKRKADDTEKVDRMRKAFKFKAKLE